MARVTADLPRPEPVTVVDSKAQLTEEEEAAARSFDPRTGMPRSLRAFVVVRDPRMTVAPHFFSGPECDHLIRLVQDSWMPSLVGQATYSSDEEYSKGDLQNALSNTRTSWSCMMRYSQTVVVERLEHRLASLAGLPTEQLERMNMVRYAPGELFDEHHDGKFRPITVFVYLSDLPEDDEEGDTFFPHLGLSFRPRRGTAVMWSNADPETGQEDSRMLHSGRAPKRGVKYGVNCFFNVRRMRQFHPAVPEFEAEQAAVVDVSALGGDARPEEQPKLTVYRLCLDPKVLAVPAFLSAAEAEHLLGAPAVAGPPETATEGPFAEEARTLRTFGAAESPAVEAIEQRLAGVAGMGLEYMARLRLVRPSGRVGWNNRGCGPKSAYICLSEGEEVFFPRLGMRLLLRCGDLLLWPNVDWETGSGTGVEDLRTLRRHGRREDLGDPSMPLIGIDVHLHDHPLREQQRMRSFVTDAEVASQVAA